MPGDLYVGGGVHMPIAAAVSFWPVAGVTEPQHYWPFSQTGDFTDQGTEGDITLTGNGNYSFNNGLVLPADTDYAVAGGYDADLNDLGSIFSILCEFSSTNLATDYNTLCGAAIYGEHGWLLANIWADTCMCFVDYDTDHTRYISNKTSGLSDNTNYQMVITFNSGTCNIYIDAGTPVTTTGMVNPSDAPGVAFIVGGPTLGHPSITIKRLGILKGTAWSADDVAAIYAAL